MNRSCSTLLMLAASLVAPLCICAQTLPNAPSATAVQDAAQETPEQKRARLHQEAEREVRQQEAQRIGGIVPNFNVVINGQGVALSPAEKFNIAFHSITDPYAFGLAAIVGGISELEDSHTGFHHGPAGYFKRAGANYADNAIGTMVGNAALPVLLHQDPRYFRRGTGSIASRIVYFASTTFVCRSDSGKTQFNTSNVLGNFISGGISNAYYPADERGAGLTILNASIVTLEGMIGAQLLEFSPDVSQYLHRRRQQKHDALTPPAATLGANDNH